MVWKTIENPIKTKDNYFSGDEAVAEAAIAAGIGYFAGYPITPTTEIMERLSIRLRQTGAVFMQMEDEISSICSCVGASWAGAKAMTVTSGPGFSLMQEGLGYAIMTETPVVIVDGQRTGPSTGRSTKVASGDMMQAKWGTHGGNEIIALSPWSVQELYDQTIMAFNLAEQYRVPVFLMAEEATAHLRERVSLPKQLDIADRERKPGAPPFGTADPNGVPPMPAFGSGEKISLTGVTHDEFGIRKDDDSQIHEKLVTRLHNKIVNNSDKIVKYETYHVDDMSTLIVAYGFTSRSALFALEKLRQEGFKIGMLRLQTIWPFPEKIVRELTSRVDKVFVPEMNFGQISGEVMKYSCAEVVPYNQVNGEVISPGTIVEQLRRLVS
jgi:2-oxoglutarate/2-oxoacid ferredoxin oxidoreductase subunit alpha